MEQNFPYFLLKSRDTNRTEIAYQNHEPRTKPNNIVPKSRTTVPIRTGTVIWFGTIIHEYIDLYLWLGRLLGFEQKRIMILLNQQEQKYIHGSCLEN